MAMTHYGADNSFLTINGIVMENYGESDPAYTISDTEDRANLKTGTGRTSLRLDHLRKPKTLVVNLMPGSDEVSQLLALEKSGADINAVHSIGGTTEKVVMFDGIIQRRGDMGRAGRTSVTDETFTIIFADSEET